MTFEYLADQMLVLILITADRSAWIDVVFDVYQHMSIKEAERTMRGSETGIRFINIIPGHKIQQWRRLLSCEASKMKLISSIVNQWKDTRQKIGAIIMYVTYNNQCFKITCDDVAEEKDPRKTQEEATMSLISIVAEDTDIILLCLSFQKDIDCDMYIKCGTTRTRTWADFHKMI